jgi:hypothetical protein
VTIKLIAAAMSDAIADMVDAVEYAFTERGYSLLLLGGVLGAALSVFID